MPDHGGKTGNHRRVKREQIKRQQNRNRAFAAIKQQHRKRKRLVACAQDIGGANIARADLADIAVAKQLC